MIYLMNKAENDTTIKKEELELKRQALEFEKSQQHNFTLLLEQQQHQIAQQNERMNQQNEIMLTLMQTMANKK